MIYDFHNVTMPLFLLTAYTKGKQADLTQDEQKSFRRIVDVLVERYSGALR